MIRWWTVRLDIFVGQRLQIAALEDILYDGSNI